MTTSRFITALYIREEDDRRRWLVIDSAPSERAIDQNSGTIVGTCAGEGSASMVARALNREAGVEPSAVAVPDKSLIHSGPTILVPRGSIDVLLASMPSDRDAWTDEQRLAVDVIQATIRADEEPF